MIGRALRWEVALGVLIGLFGSAAVLSFFESGAGSAPGFAGGPIVSECDGALGEIVIHYVGEAAEATLPTYRAFLGKLPAEVTVHVACPDEQSYKDLLAGIGATRCKLSPVIVGHALTAWSRDRWLALGGATGPETVLLCPRGEEGADIWPARAGDQRIAEDLAAALGKGLTARCSDFYFDGGDFAADGETVFVRPRVLLRNVQRTVADRTELAAGLEAALKRCIVLFDKAPDHHVGMYMMPIGDRTVLVGDPKLAKTLLVEAKEIEDLQPFFPGGPDFSEETAALFDAVAAQCRSAGYRVVRIPVVPGSDGRTYITYVNVIQDHRKDRKTVYMPVFSQAEILNRAAAAIWEKQGFEVEPIDCNNCSKYFGSLHCLVNVLRREK
jgi:hypothetical protein